MIAEIIVHRVRVPLVRPFVTAQRSTSEHEAVLVELHDEAGHSGWGEAPCSWRVTGESPQGVAAAVSGPLAAVVRGRPVSQLAAISDDVAAAIVANAAAKMAVDCALHDLAAQDAGVSLAVFLGADVVPLVTTDKTLSAGEPDEVAELAVAEHTAGFTTLKLKCGTGGDDRALVPAVRAAIGPGVTLRVDANQGWQRDEAIAIIRSWEDAGCSVACVEQPVAARALDDLAAVRSAVGTQILADESVKDSWDLAEVIAWEAADLVNIKLAKAGGLRPARQLADQAAAAGIGVLFGSMMESTVGIAAAASLAAALGATVPQDLDAGLWLRSSPVVGGARYEGGSIRLAQAPGLGIERLAAGDTR